MPNDLTRDSDRLLAEGRSLLRDNQNGGRHRLSGGSIGEGSARVKMKHFKRQLLTLIAGVFAIFVGAGIVGSIVNGIGFWGVMIVIVLMILLFGGVMTQKVKMPKRVDLTRTTDARQLVARTELWLEQQRPALPPPAVSVVDHIGVQLDGLGQQLEHVDPGHPSAREIRKLVGETLPELVESYTKIPAHLRTEERAGSTPDKQLTDSLSKVSRELDSVTRQLAEGSLDDLAIKNRYLDYKYGDAEGEPLAGQSMDQGSGVPLNFDRQKTPS